MRLLCGPLPAFHCSCKGYIRVSAEDASDGRLFHIVRIHLDKRGVRVPWYSAKFSAQIKDPITFVSAVFKFMYVPHKIMKDNDNTIGLQSLFFYLGHQQNNVKHLIYSSVFNCS